MIKLLIIADVRGWAYDRRAKALQKYCPDDFSVDIAYACDSGSLSCIAEYDLIFNIEYAMTTSIAMQIKGTGKKIPLVCSHNADHRRAMKAFNDARSYADFMIFNNREAYRHYGSLQGTCNISNGVDLDTWGVDVPLVERNDVALWTGGDGKGYPEFLNPLALEVKNCKLDLRYIGRDGWNPDRSINRDVVWDSTRMREWYNGAKIVLCSSESEATPNYVLEGMACGLVPVSTKVGNIMEFGVDGVNCRLVSRRHNSFCSGIKAVLDNYEEMAAASLKTISKWGWNERSKLFYDVFRRVYAGDIPKPFSYSEIS